VTLAGAEVSGRRLSGTVPQGYNARVPPELAELPELPEPLPMWVQWCAPAGLGDIWVGAELDPADGDFDVDGEDDDDCDDVVDTCVDDVPAVPEPPVDASATPVTPAPSPPAMTPVMMSRRTRPPVMEPIRLLPSRRPPPITNGSSLRRACPAGLPRSRSRALSPL
jgi:hypothetical protein